MFVFLIVILVTCLWGTQYRKNEYHIKPISAERVVALRGMLAIEIVLGHTYGNIPNGELLFLNSRIGVWPVGIFFMLSGYGLMVSLHKKDDYLKGFMRKRIGSIMLPFASMFLLEQLIYTWENYRIHNTNQIISISSLLERIGKYFYRDWFVCEILVIYILWYLLYKYLKEEQAIAVLLIGIIVLNVAGIATGIGTRWYGSTACFLLGILIEKWEEQIRNIFIRRYWQTIVMLGMLFLCFAIAFVLESEKAVFTAICINVTCVLLCLLVVLLLMKFTLGNVITRFLGKISWEIYVSHRLCIQCIGKLPIENSFLLMCLLLGIIVLVSYVLQVFCKSLMTGRLKSKNLVGN